MILRHFPSLVTFGWVVKPLAGLRRLAGLLGAKELTKRRITQHLHAGYYIYISVKYYCVTSTNLHTRMQLNLETFNFEGILPKGPYLQCVNMAGRAVLAGYSTIKFSHACCIQTMSIPYGCWCLGSLYHQVISSHHGIAEPCWVLSSKREDFKRGQLVPFQCGEMAYNANVFVIFLKRI